jgi:uncharacterized peroxidase-related enzyme
MPRINPIDIAAADADTQTTLAAIKATIGMVPNLYATLAQSPAVLHGFLALSGALEKGALTARQREIVALATAQVNECHYCLSAHTMLGRGAGLSAEGVRQARKGRADDPVDDAIAMLAHRVTVARGQVSDAELSAARIAGLNDAQVIEVIANVALNVFTNFTNNVALTGIDFPEVGVALAA